MKKIIITALLLVAGNIDIAQAARDYISVVGSSTVYPFSTVVAEQFGKTGRTLDVREKDG